jgi:hypothetical protein
MLRLLCCLAIALCPASSWAAGLTLREVGSKAGVRVVLTAVNRESLKVTITNDSGGPLNVEQPAGLICSTTAADASLLTLAALHLIIPSGKTAEAPLGFVALDSRKECMGKIFVPADPDPGLEPLLAQIRKSAALPREAVQLAVWSWREDLTFSDGQRFLAIFRGSTEEAPRLTPAAVVAAIDALGLLRAAAPERSFALAADPELKLRALRNPWARTKAMQLYGLTFPEAPAAPPSAVPPSAPDLRTLLHLTPGDNCPTCRQRTLLQPRDNGL